MSEDSFNMDGTVTVCEIIRHERRMSLFEYEMKMIADILSPEEQKKIKKYIVRLTKGRITFRQRRRVSLRSLAKVDKTKK